MSHGDSPDQSRRLTGPVTATYGHWAAVLVSRPPINGGLDYSPALLFNLQPEAWAGAGLGLEAGTAKRPRAQLTAAGGGGRRAPRASSARVAGRVIDRRSNESVRFPAIAAFYKSSDARAGPPGPAHRPPRRHAAAGTGLGPLQPHLRKPQSRLGLDRLGPGGPGVRNPANPAFSAMGHDDVRYRIPMIDLIL